MALPPTPPVPVRPMMTLNSKKSVQARKERMKEEKERRAAEKEKEKAEKQ
jgi:ubiquitin carboxyl-terminal hydrolase 9/13